MTSRRPALPWLSTLAWAGVGALGAFGIAGLATIGLFLLAGAVLLAAVALSIPALRPPCAPGFLVGLSTAPLYIAWLNRDGPGLVCTTTPESMSCADQWSPWPFVALGVLFAGAGLVLLLVTRRGSDQPSGVGTGAPGSVVQT
ncbi:MAG TPA: hypothetical protein VFL10_08755 [Ornithinibacter sp.]|nr:hypothetical protein [Ornithinibacter sp.]